MQTGWNGSVLPMDGVFKFDTTSLKIDIKIDNNIQAPVNTKMYHACMYGVVLIPGNCGSQSIPRKGVCMYANAGIMYPWVYQICLQHFAAG
jgi:hypothetical protein